MTDDDDRRAGGGTGAADTWALSPRQAMALQQHLAPQVVRKDRFAAPPALVCGIDVAYDGRRGPARAAAALFRLDDLALVEQAVVTADTAFPYVPGLLSFREAPVAIAAIAALKRKPDLLLCDGQGIAHPRRLGFASHLGLALDLPSIGVAKSRLCGRHGEPGPEPGDWTPLLDADEIIGAVLRTRRRCRPLYISIGHRVSLATAIALVLRCGRGLRLPEPCRIADRLSKAAKSTSAARPSPPAAR
jgi:deoxyribonuclease V